ncbi:hypothetical protein D9756_001860 [Leucocoprinus leucothites]|uniref:NYN domain-containing protein n=1 Tax=Leucocoprinus leucothites TaxID=201217 RepID=A0A8H5G4M3_9AGAR|nr:hypothetical protein D9756_001860 [Leucoagaricus leucothites]
MPRPKIKIFWDLVTCPLPTSYSSVGELLKDVRTFTSNFGVVTSIKAYWDKRKSRAVDESLRAEMPSMGVNLVDCSSMQGYTNDALTKMLSVDVVMSAMDDPVNTEAFEDDIIMIISGDKSVLYPISLLMFRNYTVFLVVPDDDSNTQDFQATRVFSWKKDVLRCALSLEPTGTLISENLKSSVNGWIVNGTRIPQLNLDSPSVARSPSNAVSPRSGQPAQISSPRPMTTVTSPAATSMDRGRSILPSEPSTSRAPSVLSLGSDPRITTQPLMSFDATVSEPRTATKPPTSFDTTNATVSEPRVATKPLGATPETTKETVQPPNTQEPSEGSQPVDDWAAAGGWSQGGSWETAGFNWLSEPSPAPKTAAKSKEAPRKMVPLESSKPNIQKKPQAQARDSGSTKENKGPPTKTEVKASHDPPMSVFDPLVEILRGAEKESMMRSQLGEQLAKRKGLYQSAGVSGFGEFIGLAAKKNIIAVTGGDIGHQQVKLRKRR